MPQTVQPWGKGALRAVPTSRFALLTMTQGQASMFSRRIAPEVYQKTYRLL
jgi:hypothetical protein